MSTLIIWPFLALLPAAVFAVLYLRCRRPAVLVAALFWFAYFPYELGMKFRVLCSGECNIRVDLLLLYPALALTSLSAIVAFVKGSTGAKRPPR
jgi:hypothetical protein